jgi:hypothetical protein
MNDANDGAPISFTQSEDFAGDLQIQYFEVPSYHYAEEANSLAVALIEIGLTVTVTKVEITGGLFSPVRLLVPHKPRQRTTVDSPAP